MSPAPDVLTIDGLVRTFGAHRAVDGVRLRLGPGRVMALVGPNGAGKTTLMRTMVGLLRPDAGEVRIAGVDPFRDPVGARQHLAWVPHAPALFDSLTVWEHLALTAELWRTTGWEDEAVALLRRFELDDKRDADVGSLSTGMRQKVALVAAAVHRPALYVLDEPHNGLDPHAIREMRGWVAGEQARGASFLISSHLLALIQDLSTDLLILVRGVPTFVGTLDEARARWPGADLEAVFFQATGLGA